MTDFRTLCEQLMELAEGKRYDGSAVIAKARAALAQPETVAPTDEELDELYFDFEAGHVESWRHFVRAVLARWGTPANTINQEDY